MREVEMETIVSRRMSSNILKKLCFGLKIENNKSILPLPNNSKNEKIKIGSKKRTCEDIENGDKVFVKKQKIDYDDVTFFGQSKKKSKVPLSEEKLTQIEQEKINHFRNERHIHVYGIGMPDPIESFEQLFKQYNIHKTYFENLKAMGFTAPTPVQMQAITAILHKHDVMVCAPTGSGKTLAFSLPILHQLEEHKDAGFRVLILAPTRELAKQIQLEMLQVSKGTSLKIRYLQSSKTFEDRKKWINADVVITTPKKFVHVLKKHKSEINLKNIQWLVVDESDKLFEAGDTGFRQQLGTIYKSCHTAILRTLLFSATFSQEVEQWCQLNLNNLLRIYIGNINAATDTISQQLLYAGSEAGKLHALRNIFKEGFPPPVLIFTQSKQRAEELYTELSYDGMSVEAIHSDKSDVQRDGIVKSFISGKIHILICTDIMGRGLDFKNVNLVINYDFPTSAVAYIHRIGRTGRAGRPGKAITFFTNNDVLYLRSVVNLMRQSGCEVPEYMLKIQKPSRRVRKKLASKVPEREPIINENLMSEEMKTKMQKMKKKKKTLHKKRTYKKKKGKELVKESN